MKQLHFLISFLIMIFISENAFAADNLYGRQLICKVNNGNTWITLSFESERVAQVLMRKRDIRVGGSFLKKGVIESYETNTKEIIIKSIRYLYRDRVIRRDTLETFIRWDELASESLPFDPKDNGKCALWKGKFKYFHESIDKIFQQRVRELKSGNKL